MVVRLTPRSRQILEAVVEEYIATAEPVASSVVARRRELPVSPATVRNVMADLEDLGLLASPHTSAGRIPTEKAYRFYVDSLVSLRPVTDKEKKEIARRCRQAGSGISGILRETSRALASLSNYMGIVVAPSFTADIFRHIEFIRLGSCRVLAILVSCNGNVQNRLIETDQDFSSDELIRMGNYLNELMDGLTISQARERIREEMQKEKNCYDSLLSNALKMSRDAVRLENENIFVEGQASILDQPEFSDVKKMREIYRTFEQKAHLLKLLNDCMRSEGVRIYIGSETPMGNSAGISLIASRFVTSSNTIGLLGIIGPTRMGYSSVIPIVDYTAGILNRLLKEN